MDRDDALVLDILESTRQVAGYLDGFTRESFLSDAKTRDAVERRILIMGEAANKLSVAFRDGHPDIPWAQLIRLRNFYVHGYDKLEAENVWGTARGLVRRVESLLAKLLPQDTDS